MAGPLYQSEYLWKGIITTCICLFVAGQRAVRSCRSQPTGQGRLSTEKGQKSEQSPGCCTPRGLKRSLAEQQAEPQAEQQAEPQAEQQAEPQAEQQAEPQAEQQAVVGQTPCEVQRSYTKKCRRRWRLPEVVSRGVRYERHCRTTRGQVFDVGVTPESTAQAQTTQTTLTAQRAATADGAKKADKQRDKRQVCSHFPLLLCFLFAEQCVSPCV